MCRILAFGMSSAEAVAVLDAIRDAAADREAARLAACFEAEELDVSWA